jgi:dipeptidyl aminopeptidase/acylaminoacyl peptidase
MKKQYGFASLILSITLFIGACSKSDTKDDISLAAEEKLSISYAAGEKNTFDLYLPANRNADTKTVVLIHGGFWFGGNKEELTEYAKFLQQQGFAVANINYRLTNTNENNIHPAQVNDIQKAIDYISAKASEWNISDDFGLVGASAGGHLALLYTYAYNTGNKVKTVVSIAGPTNLSDTRNTNNTQRQIVSLLLGSTLEQNPTVYAQASPITHVSSSTKPTLLVHGKLDAIVPYQQAVDLKARLEENNIKNNLLLYDNAGHENVINEQNRSLVLPLIADWLDSTIK